jgi:hypothetical protein
MSELPTIWSEVRGKPLILFGDIAPSTTISILRVPHTF